MEIEIYKAFITAGVPDPEARAAVESINKEIDRRYSLHAQQLVTRGDLKETEARLDARLADAKVEIIKWTVGTMFAAVGLFAALTKLWQ
ncbi:hypothetical protein [Aquabacterium sp. A08]|uniref:hypothetical protein n=1 Tax=Aquabacterium sp. A08 TaxID=2718532 RepID=UPI00141E6816|nr:hypothetical protein [Aquabacterium sp. A08]NIC40166.1 hypothetical protein [Aquabacterium sp. A08]